MLHTDQVRQNLVLAKLGKLGSTGLSMDQPGGKRKF